MKTVVVTTTFYKSEGELRFQLAQDFVRSAIVAGYEVVIVDASPLPQVATVLRELGAQVFLQLHEGMGPGRRQAFFHAQESVAQPAETIFVWSEPEKVDLIRSIPQIVRPIEEGEAEVVVPRRSAKSWETWPTFQRETEQEANRQYNDIFQTTDRDPMFGPVALDGSFIDPFILKEPVAGVEDTYVQHYATLLAESELGATVRSVEIDTTYPPEQKAEEEATLNQTIKEKRIWQRDSLVRAYRLIHEYVNK
jgi:hypothetical protein